MGSKGEATSGKISKHYVDVGDTKKVRNLRVDSYLPGWGDNYMCFPVELMWLFMHLFEQDVRWLVGAQKII